MMRQLLFGIGALSCLFACAPNDEVAMRASGLEAQNGQNLNGQNLNGQNLNGQNLNGQNLNGPDTGTFLIWTSLEGVRLNGQTLTAPTQLTSTVFSNGGLQGMDFLEAELRGRRGDGRDVRLRLRHVYPPAPGGDTWRYLVEYREDDQRWYPICENASGPVLAIPLNGTWNHNFGNPGGGDHASDPLRFTFACENQGALGKCVAMGYAPWRSEGGVQLDGHHQACVRLIRGDYCGDGTPYTTDGNRVNLYDGLGIQDDTENWVVEAEWDRDGARCFYPLNRSRAGIPCYDARVAAACGSPTNFSSGALLINETPSGGILP